MYSTRNHLWVRSTAGIRAVAALGLVVSVLLSSVGCQSNKTSLSEEIRKYQYKAPEPTPPAGPMDIDEAMVLRDWSPSYAYIADSSLVAYSTRFPLNRSTVDKYVNNDISAGNPYYYPYSILQTAAFVGQTLALPFTYLVTPPFTKVRYYVSRSDASYTSIGATSNSAGGVSGGTSSTNAPTGASGTGAPSVTPQGAPAGGSQSPGTAAPEQSPLSPSAGPSRPERPTSPRDSASPGVEVSPTGPRSPSGTTPDATPRP